jgi:hypothetical protein
MQIWSDAEISACVLEAENRWQQGTGRADTPPTKKYAVAGARSLGVSTSEAG